MANYLITGGLGFIGWNLCKKLAERADDKVVAYDNELYFKPENASFWPAYIDYRKRELKEAGVELIYGDVANFDRLRTILDRYEPEYIVHLAALPLSNEANEQPEEAHRNIYRTTETLLEAIRVTDFTPCRVVYTSSSMVYGDFDIDSDGEVVPASEDDTCNPKGIYGTLKLNGERITETYSSQYDIPCTIVRPSAVYGPTDCNRRVTEIFITNAIQGKELRLDNGGQQQLDFTYVDDLVDGYVKVLDDDSAINETFNLTYGEGVPIRRLAAVIDEHVADVQTRSVEREVNRPNRGELDTSKARRLLGYDPSYSLEDGIRSTYDWIRSEGFLEMIEQESIKPYSSARP